MSTTYLQIHTISSPHLDIRTHPLVPFLFLFCLLHSGGAAMDIGREAPGRCVYIYLYAYRWWYAYPHRVPLPQHSSRHGPQLTHHTASTAVILRYPRGIRQTPADARPHPLALSKLTYPPTRSLCVSVLLSCAVAARPPADEWNRQKKAHGRRWRRWRRAALPF